MRIHVTHGLISLLVSVLRGVFGPATNVIIVDGREARYDSRLRCGVPCQPGEICSFTHRLQRR
jgi:hypothetical protein